MGKNLPAMKETWEALRRGEKKKNHMLTLMHMLTSSVTLDRSVSLSEAQFPQLKMRIYIYNVYSINK